MLTESPDKYDKSGNLRFADHGKSTYDYSYQQSQTKAYDSNNRVTSISDNSGRTTNYYYDLNGNIVLKEYPNGVKTAWTFDSFNRIIAISTQKDGAEIARDDYSFDKAGNLNNIVRKYQNFSHRINHTYDSLHDFLMTESMYDENETLKWQNSFQYSGKRLSSVSRWTYFSDGFSKADIKYTYRNNTNLVNKVQHSEVVKTSGTMGGEIIDKYDRYFSYDSLGNLCKISDVESGEATTFENFTYDGYGRLKDYTNGSLTCSYKYDYRGRRVCYVKDGVTTNYYYSGGVSYLEETGGNLIQYYRGPDMGGGVGGINYACKVGGADLNYKHYDERGDVVGTTDANGNVLSQSYYYAFGKHEDFGAMPSDKHRANTKVEDTETNLLLEGHRYRHLEYNMFMSPDPLEYVDSSNLYAYCGNNPWGRFDPDGLWTLGMRANVTLVFFTLSIGLHVDDDFGVAVNASGGGGLEASASASLGITVTTADSVKDLEGNSIEAGGSAKMIKGAEIHGIAGGRAHSDEQYMGLDVGYGVGFSSGLGGYITKSKNIYEANVDNGNRSKNDDSTNSTENKKNDEHSSNNTAQNDLANDSNISSHSKSNDHIDAAASDDE